VEFHRLDCDASGEGRQSATRLASRVTRVASERLETSTPMMSVPRHLASLSDDDLEAIFDALQAECDRLGAIVERDAAMLRHPNGIARLEPQGKLLLRVSRLRPRYRELRDRYLAVSTERRRRAWQPASDPWAEETETDLERLEDAVEQAR
jgi:hypothetical protein